MSDYLYNTHPEFLAAHVRAQKAKEQAERPLDAAKWNRRTSPIPQIRAAVERMIGTTNIPLSAARVRVAAIEEVLEILDGIESSETNDKDQATRGA
jgi:hypothetical protein